MVSFELGKKNRERCFSVLSQAWDKEKIPSPHEELNLKPSDSMLRCSTNEPQETTLWAKSIRKFIWHVSCILLGSAMSISIMFVDRNKGDGRFWAQYRNGERGFFIFSLAWDKKNSESSWGTTPQTFRFRTLMLYHWTTETPQWVRFITKFILHASCILLGSAMLIA